MKIIKDNIFEFSFIAALSVTGGSLFSFLFGLSLTGAIGISLILGGLFSGFYLLVIRILNKNDNSKTQKVVAKKEKYKFVAMETNNVVQKLPPQPIVKVEKKVEKIEEFKKSPVDIFKDNPIGELESTRDFIIDLLNKTQSSYNRIEKIFGERMHKNTKTDIQSFLYLKQLNESLSKRLEQVIDLLDLIEKENKISLKKSFELAYGPLALPNDSFSSIVSGQIKEIPTLPREEWETAVQTTIKKLSRKKTFHHALNYAIYN